MKQNYNKNKKDQKNYNNNFYQLVHQKYCNQKILKFMRNNC